MSERCVWVVEAMFDGVDKWEPINVFRARSDGREDVRWRRRNWGNEDKFRLAKYVRAKEGE